jgi:uncharacterized protein (AIM24 family)
MSNDPEKNDEGPITNEGLPPEGATVLKQTTMIDSTGNEYDSNTLNEPYSNLGAKVQNNNGYDILKFSLAPGASIVTNQDTLAYMDGGLRTLASARGGILTSIARSITGESVLQNIVANPTQNTLKIVLSPLLQGSIVVILIKPGESWRFSNKSFVACTPNVSVGGNINVFQNFKASIIGGSSTYTTLSIKKDDTIGYGWICGYGAIEKHVINMGDDGSTVPLYVNVGSFLGMLDSYQYDNGNTINYWDTYVKVGLPGSFFDSLFTSIGFIMKIQDTVPSKMKTSCVVITQSLNIHNFEKYVTALVSTTTNEQKRGFLNRFFKGGNTRKARSRVNISRRKNK